MPASPRGDHGLESQPLRQHERTPRDWRLPCIAFSRSADRAAGCVRPRLRTAQGLLRQGGTIHPPGPPVRMSGELSQNSCRLGPGPRSLWNGTTRTRGLPMGNSHPVERRRWRPPHGAHERHYIDDDEMNGSLRCGRAGAAHLDAAELGRGTLDPASLGTSSTHARHWHGGHAGLLLAEAARNSCAVPD